MAKPWLTPRVTYFVDFVSSKKQQNLQFQIPKTILYLFCRGRWRLHGNSNPSARRGYAKHSNGHGHRLLQSATGCNSHHLSLQLPSDDSTLVVPSLGGLWQRHHSQTLRASSRCLYDPCWSFRASRCTTWAVERHSRATRRRQLHLRASGHSSSFLRGIWSGCKTFFFFC